MIHAYTQSSLSQNQQKTITQMIHGWLPVNGHPGRWQNLSHKLCPTCHNTIETQDHFISCTSHVTLIANLAKEFAQLVFAITEYSFNNKKPALAHVPEEYN
jgi:hypothetical protein